MTCGHKPSYTSTKILFKRIFWNQAAKSVLWYVILLLWFDYCWFFSRQKNAVFNDNRFFISYIVRYISILILVNSSNQTSCLTRGEQLQSPWINNLIIYLSLGNSKMKKGDMVYWIMIIKIFAVLCAHNNNRFYLKYVSNILSQEK